MVFLHQAHVLKIVCTYWAYKATIIHSRSHTELVLQNHFHVQRFLMINKVTFTSCLIFTLLTLEVVSYMMCKFLIPDKFTFVTSLIFTFRTLEYLSHMYRYLMSNKVTFLSCLMFTLWTLEFLTYMHRF
jgi:hypothetical protein